MSVKNQTALRVVLYEGDGSEMLPDPQRFEALSALLDNGFAVTRSVANGRVSSPDNAPVFVLGQFKDERIWESEDSDGQVKVRFKNLAGLDVPAILEAVEAARAEVSAFKHGEWKPWFPVIDYERCTNCMQCLSFCLFDVYGVDDAKQIQVQNNDNCKTNCPACSRVCPEAAIMFPKYKSGPINGDVVNPEDLQREKMKVDISSLLGGDVYQMLRHRSEQAKSRFSKERDSGKALKERQRCLTALAQAGDIPPEVLMSLPSADEIQRRAEAAAEKARKALEN